MKKIKILSDAHANHLNEPQDKGKIINYNKEMIEKDKYIECIDMFANEVKVKVQ